MCVYLNPDSSAANRLGAAAPEVVHTKTPLLIVLGAIVLVAGSGLAIIVLNSPSNLHARRNTDCREARRVPTALAQ